MKTRFRRGECPPSRTFILGQRRTKNKLFLDLLFRQDWEKDGVNKLLSLLYSVLPKVPGADYACSGLTDHSIVLGTKSRHIFTISIRHRQPNKRTCL